MNAEIASLLNQADQATMARAALAASKAIALADVERLRPAYLAAQAVLDESAGKLLECDEAYEAALNALEDAGIDREAVEKIVAQRLVALTELGVFATPAATAEAPKLAVASPAVVKPQAQAQAEEPKPAAQEKPIDEPKPVAAKAPEEKPVEEPKAAQAGRGRGRSKAEAKTEEVKADQVAPVAEAAPVIEEKTAEAAAPEASKAAETIPAFLTGEDDLPAFLTEEAGPEVVAPPVVEAVVEPAHSVVAEPAVEQLAPVAVEEPVAAVAVPAVEASEDDEIDPEKLFEDKSWHLSAEEARDDWTGDRSEAGDEEPLSDDGDPAPLVEDDDEADADEAEAEVVTEAVEQSAPAAPAQSAAFANPSVRRRPPSTPTPPEEEAPAAVASPIVALPAIVEAPSLQALVAAHPEAAPEKEREMEMDGVDDTVPDWLLS